MKNKIAYMIILYWVLFYIYKVFSVSEWDIITIGGIEYIARPVESVTKYWDLFYFTLHNILIMSLFAFLWGFYIGILSKVAKVSFFIYCCLTTYNLLKYLNFDLLQINESIVWNTGFGVILIVFIYIFIPWKKK